MGKTVKRDWIIGVGGSELDDVLVFKFTGTVRQAKLKLLDMIKEDRAGEEFQDWWSGTENIEEIQEFANGRLYAYGCWDNYHIDYSATPTDAIEAA